MKYEISKSTCYRNIRWVEDTLIKSGKFSLPGRKTLVKNHSKYAVVLIDVTETPIERPQKNKDTFISVKRSDIH